jgi:hypothetical protein
MYTADVLPVGGDTAQLLWDTYITYLYSIIDGLVSTLYTVSNYELQAYQSGHWVPYELVDFDFAGEDAQDPMPFLVSVVLMGKATGLRHVGRKFLGPITEYVSSGNALVAGAMVVAGQALLGYITPVTGIGGGTLTPGVVDQTGQFHPFAGGAVSSLLGTMRRRKPGRGI